MRLERTAILLTSTMFALSLATASGQQVSQSPPPDSVEEDWQLVIAYPDPLSVGPQITTVMSPVSDNSAPFIAFDMNYIEYPIFSAGGMQIQIWSGGKVIGTSAQGNALFNTPNETITWTQRMSLSGNSVSYDIENGQSTTWGKFGQGAQLSATFTSTLSDLSGYSPASSATSSGASWQSNLVTSLTLVQVRYYANGQLLRTDTNPRTLIAAPSNSN